MIKLNNIKQTKGANRNTKRLGRGPGSGQGCQSGKGHKGQKARKSGHVRLGFEGNNLPMYMRLPKTRNFTNFRFRKLVQIIDLSSIDIVFKQNEIVSRDTLIEKGVLKNKNKLLPIKVLAKLKTFSKQLTFMEIDKFSKSAENLIRNSGSLIKEK